MKLSPKHIGIIIIFISSIVIASIVVITVNQESTKKSSGGSGGNGGGDRIDNDFQIKGGTLTENETWSGAIHVRDSVKVPEGITLTILPGTFVEFKHYRGYKDYGILVLIVDGGTINATGAANKQIWFTSDAEDPINGDWGGIVCSNTNTSIFKYVIVEFGIIGIELDHSNITVSHSIIRWIHTEGVYSSASSGLFEYNRIYANGYHEMSLENFNKNLTIINNIFNGGHYGIYAEATEVNITGNYFVNYTGTAISGGSFSNLTIKYNNFKNNGVNISLDFTTTNISDGNGYGNPIPALEYADSKPRSLDYVPGDPEDRYLYVFDSLDETRNITLRLHNQTSFDWTLEFVNNSLWKFNHRSSRIGIYSDFVKINYTHNITTPYENNDLINPSGLAYDGDFFWTYDIVFNKVFKFKINSSDDVEIFDSFALPGVIGTTSGIATNGTSLFVPGSGGTKLYELDKLGNLLNTINLTGGQILGVLTWTNDNYFWANSETQLTKWYMNGTLAGKIYPAAEGTIGITWDGTHLWTSQKTCELWTDGKIFQINIIDDQFLLQP